MIRRPPRSTLFPSPTLFRPRRRRRHGYALRRSRRVRPLRLPRPPPRPPLGQRLRPRTQAPLRRRIPPPPPLDRKSTRLNSSHANISYAVFCLKKKQQQTL